jgi:hypothetical protein
LPIFKSQEQVNSIGSYYLTPISIWNNQHHNAVPDNTNNKQNLNLGDTFKEKNNINPLLPFEGDNIFEGRWGNSIRLGSTVKNKNNNWSLYGDNGDPILIIKNGIISKNDSWICLPEDINNDLSSIYYTSTQKIPIKTSSKQYKSFKSDSPINPEEYTKPQIIVTSDRILINSKKDHILLSSNKSINLNSNEYVTIDAKKGTIIDTPELLLGSNKATEHLLLGDKSIQLFKEVLDEMISLTKQLSVLTSLPPSSPFIPLNAQSTKSQLKLTLLKNKLNTLLSKQNKTI